jgi:hypothetical protein
LPEPTGQGLALPFLPRLQADPGTSGRFCKSPGWLAAIPVRFSPTPLFFSPPRGKSYDTVPPPPAAFGTTLAFPWPSHKENAAGSEVTMSQRDRNLLWLSDMVDHLRHCQHQLSWSEDPETIEVLTETMLRDLESCRRLCLALRRSSHPAGNNWSHSSP